MAEVKNFVYAMLFVVALLSFGAGLFSFGISVGGWSAEYPRSFANAEQYLNKSADITSTLANQTAKVGEAPASTDPTLTYGTILTVGLQIITVPMDALNLAISMLTDISATPGVGGFIPAWFYLLAIIFMTMTLIFGILAAVVKWYL